MALASFKKFMARKRKCFMFRRTSAVSFIFFCSPCGVRGAGGVLTLLRKAAFPRDATFSSTTLVAGRFLKVVVERNHASMAIYNLHNNSIKSEDWFAAKTVVSADLARAAGFPLDFSVWLGGDFNFLSKNESPHSISGGGTT